MVWSWWLKSTRHIKSWIVGRRKKKNWREF
jgi:hypothetical protein